MKIHFKIVLLLIISIFNLDMISAKSRAEKLLSKKEKAKHAAAYELQKNYIDPFIKQRNENIKSYIEEMPLEERIAQMFIENLEGNTKFRSYETFDRVTKNPSDSNRPIVAGGYLFFSFNLCNTPEEQKSFMKSISEYCEENNQLKPFLAIDQEGGWVNRLSRLTGGLPSQEKVAAENSITEAYDLYSDQAEKMADLGFHMNLAPVIEVCTDDNREFLNGRSFGSASQVKDYGIASVNAYQNNQIGAVIKHFPGNTNTDPHVGLPVISLSKTQIDELLEPFKAVTEKEPVGVLMSHAIISSVDEGTPACLSSVWVTDILRNEYNYKGIIFSDDIFMGALANNGYPPERAAVMAVEAGIDCIMISEKRFAKSALVLYKKALEDKAFEERINESVYRILKYKLDSKIISYDDLGL